MRAYKIVDGHSAGVDGQIACGSQVTTRALAANNSWRRVGRAGPLPDIAAPTYPLIAVNARPGGQWRHLPGDEPMK